MSIDYKKVILLNLLLSIGLGCSQRLRPSTIVAKPGGISNIERTTLEQNSQTQVPVLVSGASQDLALKEFTLLRQKADRIENVGDQYFAEVTVDGATALAWADTGQVMVALNASVLAELPSGVKSIDESSVEPIDEQALFGGKLEFGLRDFEKRFPDADGRGVRIAVVDDGIALNRPGLSETTTSQRKIIRSVNSQPVWWAPIRENDDPFKSDLAQFKNETDFDFKNRIGSFQIGACGANPELKIRSRDCVKWDTVGLSSKMTGAVLKDSNSEIFYLVDLNGNQTFEKDEVLYPFRSEKSPRQKILKNSEPFVLEWLNENEVDAPKTNSTDHIAGQANDKKLLGMVSVTLPEAGIKAGEASHGEGVASVAAGHRIAGRNFSGVAPGAQIVDIDLTPPAGVRSYTIGDIARALAMGGKSAQIVNLSYSLFFQSAAAQAAMGRWMEERLKSVPALFMFSAGNNGPGRKSMNRGLIYPSFSIPVGAYLTPEMSQSAFGSANPIGGVVTYSSRGPGIDGASSALVISPLAGLYVGPFQTGIKPFSGTSSATPALSGFAARVLSAIQQMGLSFDRRILRESIIESARPLPGVPFIDQGYGLPQLSRAVDLYVEKTKTPSPLSSLSVTVSTQNERNSRGITKRGWVIEGRSERSFDAEVRVRPIFVQGTSPQVQDAFTLPVRIVARFGKVQVPQAGLLSVAGFRFSARLDSSAFLKPGEVLDEIEIQDALTGRRLSVVPVSVFNPTPMLGGQMRSDVAIQAGHLERFFFERPEGASHLMLTRQAIDDGIGLCGRASLYNPDGIRLAMIDGGSDRMVDESLFETAVPGMYEWVIEARASHTDCPSQSQALLAKWIGLQVQAVSASAGKTIDATVVIQSKVGSLRGTLALDRWWTRNTFSLNALDEDFGVYRSSDQELGSSSQFLLRFESNFLGEVNRAGNYSYFDLGFNTLSPQDRELLPRSIFSGPFVSQFGVFEFSRKSLGLSEDALESKGQFSLSLFDRVDGDSLPSIYGEALPMELFSLKWSNALVTIESAPRLALLEDQAQAVTTSGGAVTLDSSTSRNLWVSGVFRIAGTRMSVPISPLRVPVSR